MSHLSILFINLLKLKIRPDDNSKFVIGEFHISGHEPACDQFHPKKVEGAGTKSFEDTEWLWSMTDKVIRAIRSVYLILFLLIFLIMTSENYYDTMNFALESIACFSIEAIGTTIMNILNILLYIFLVTNLEKSILEVEKKVSTMQKEFDEGLKRLGMTSEQVEEHAKVIMNELTIKKKGVPQCSCRSPFKARPYKV